MVDFVEKKEKAVDRPPFFYAADSEVWVLIAAGTFILSWLIPNHYFPWPSFYSEAFAWITLFVLVVSRLAVSGFLLPRPTLFLFVVSLVPLIQFGFGVVVFRGDALLAFAYVASLALAFGVGFSWARDSADLPAYWLHFSTFAAACISAMLAMFQFLRIEVLGIWLIDMPPWGRPFGNLGQPNQLATLCCMGLVSLLWLYEKRVLGKVGAWLSSICLVVGLVMTQSKTPWLFILIFVVWWHIYGRGLFLRTRTSTLWLLVFLYVVLTLSWPAISSSLYLFGETLSQRVGATSGARVAIWRALADAIAQRPLFGWGWGQVATALATVAADHPPIEYVEHSNNLFVDLFVWNGMPLGALMSLGVVYWLLSRTHSVKTTNGATALMVVVAILSHAMVEFPHDYMYFLVAAGLASGLVEAEYPCGRLMYFNKRALMVFLIGGFFCLVAITSDYLKMEEYGREFRLASAGFVDTKMASVPPEIYVLDNLRAFFLFANSRARPGMSDDDLERMRKVVFRYPTPPALFRLALALALNQHLEGAKRTMQTLRMMHGEVRYKEGVDGVYHAAREGLPKLRPLCNAIHGDC